MEFFPVINSVLSAEHVTLWVAEQHGFRNVQCRLLKTNMNDTYLVTAKEGRYILRAYSHEYRTPAQVSEEVRILMMLKQNNVSVAFPVSSLESGFILNVQAPEGERCVVLFAFAEGDKVRFLTNEMSRAIGVLTGKLHQVTINEQTTRKQYSTKTLAGWAYAQVARRFAECTEDLSFIRACEEMLEKAFHNPSSYRQGIVHLDIWYDNMSIGKDGKVTLFDFDNCGHGWLVLDLGYFCMQLFLIEGDTTTYEEKKSSFIKGYRSVAQVSDDELALIPYAGLAIWIYYLGVQAERFDSFGNFFLSANYIRMFLNKAKDWLSHHNIVVEQGIS